MEEHLAMMDALTQRNAEQLAKLMQTHMTRKCETVIKELGSKWPTHLYFPPQTR